MRGEFTAGNRDVTVVVASPAFMATPAKSDQLGGAQGAGATSAPISVDCGIRDWPG